MIVTNKTKRDRDVPLCIPFLFRVNCDDCLEVVPFCDIIDIILTNKLDQEANMIFNKDVLQVIKTIEENGSKAYVYGDAVKEGYIGRDSWDWDIITDMEEEPLCEIFPKARLLREDVKGDLYKSTIRLDMTYTDDQGELLGSIIDIKTGVKSFSDFLGQSDFTIYAMGSHPQKSLIDPFNGKADAKKRVLRTVRPADSLFEEKPELMMKTLRLVAETGFDLDTNLYNAIVTYRDRLLDKDKKLVTDEFITLMGSPYVCKALQFLVGSGLILPILGGEQEAKMISMKEMKFLNGIMEHLDEISDDSTLRLALFYRCFKDSRILKVIKNLDFPEDVRIHLEDVANKYDRLSMMKSKITFKRFAGEMGEERFTLLYKVARARLSLFAAKERSLDKRMKWIEKHLREIKSFGEPLYLDDLAITSEDILEAGIVGDEKEADKLLWYTLAIAHKNPYHNNRYKLLQGAKKYKNPILASLRYFTLIK